MHKKTCLWRGPAELVADGRTTRAAADLFGRAHAALLETGLRP